MLKAHHTGSFKGDLKKAERQHRNMTFLAELMDNLVAEQSLDPRHRDHALQGKWQGYRECHVQNDWLLVYKVDKQNNIIGFARLGTHSEIFKN